MTLTELIKAAGRGEPIDSAARHVARVRMKFAAFADFTQNLAGLSQCQRLRVGCTVVRPDLSEVVAIGYNGPPAGLPNDGCRSSAGACGCVHAEANALLKLKVGTPGLILLATDSPCEHCAGLILNSGGRVRAVAYARAYRDPSGLNRLVEGGVTVATWAAVRGRNGNEKTPA